ncbi:MAG TPA: alpha/beta hydrolase [Blastocatellia bacterium]|nr:alpha/beta hydrolase [Blastocatellia bacterium]
MSFITVNQSPLLPGVSPVEIHYREYGNASGTPLVFLHGGWGYEVYPFDRQVETFGKDCRIVIPDRTGYGRSMRINSLPVDFHRRAAREMMSFLDALDMEGAILWGHSDGAVIAMMMALQSPHRFAGIILEAFHYYRDKPGSKGFFETMSESPEMLGGRVTKVLAEDHGEDYWKELIVINGLAWLGIAEQSARPKQDLYDGKLRELSVPTLFLHGSDDPRTEPGELDAVREELKRAEMRIIQGGGHAPHSQKSVADECNRIAAEFMRGLNRPRS